MKIGFIGCVESSLIAINVLLSMKGRGIEVVAVITKNKSTFNADHVDLSEVCKEQHIPYHFEDSKKKSDSLEFMRAYQPDIIYCFGWSFLLDSEFLKMSPKGVIGFHPAKLPQNRGRHPIIWALVLGLESTASTFFKMEHGADTGPILNQVDISISPEDDANDLYQNVLTNIKFQIKEFTLQLANNTAEFKVQDHSKATSWRKRTRKDGLIDWRMRAEDIYNLIRALSKPYPGAEFEFLGDLVPVLRSKVSDNQFLKNIEPGTILEAGNHRILVKSGGNTAIWLLDLEMKKLPLLGEYL